MSSRFPLLLGHGAQPKMTYSPRRRKYYNSLLVFYKHIHIKSTVQINLWDTHVLCETSSIYEWSQWKGSNIYMSMHLTSNTVYKSDASNNAHRMSWLLHFVQIFQSPWCSYNCLPGLRVPWGRRAMTKAEKERTAAVIISSRWINHSVAAKL